MTAWITIVSGVAAVASVGVTGWMARSTQATAEATKNSVQATEASVAVEQKALIQAKDALNLARNTEQLHLLKDILDLFEVKVLERIEYTVATAQSFNICASYPGPTSGQFDHSGFAKDASTADRWSPMLHEAASPVKVLN